MPTINYPKSDIGRTDFIMRATTTNEADQSSGKPYLMTTTWEKLIALEPQFNALVVGRSSSTGKRQQEVIEKNEAISKLQLFCSHGLKSVINRVERNEEPVTILANYTIGSTGNLPLLPLTSKLITIADQIIEGDAKTVAMGYPAMINPSIDEIDALNEIAKKELADVSTADRTIDVAAEEIALVRGDVDILIRDIVADLNYTMRHSDDASRRRIMRSYGVDFKSSVVDESVN